MAVNCRSRCQEQRIPFYRFSPTLESVVETAETDDRKLIDMLTRTKLEACTKWKKELQQLNELFKLVANTSNKYALKSQAYKPKLEPTKE